MENSSFNLNICSSNVFQISFFECQHSKCSLYGSPCAFIWLTLYVISLWVLCSFHYFSKLSPSACFQNPGYGNCNTTQGRWREQDTSARWQPYIRTNGIRIRNTKIGIFTVVRYLNLTNLKNHTADIRIWLFWRFQLGAFLQPIYLVIPTNAHNMLNVHLVRIKIRNLSEFSVYPVPLLPALHVYTQLLKPLMFETVLCLCPLKLSYSNFIIVLSHIAANISILFISPVYKSTFSAEITNEWTCTSTSLTRSLSAFSRFTWHLYRSGAGKASQYNDKAKSWTIRESWFDSQQGFPSTSKKSTQALRSKLPPLQRTLGVKPLCFGANRSHLSRPTPV